MRNQTGVTLMELMIVMVVIGILSAIAYPSYRDQVRRSNRTEGKVALEQNAQALEKCFTRYMRYDDVDNCPAAAQFEDNATVTTPGGHYRVAGEINATTFTLTAVPQGGQASDTRCMNLTLTSAGARGISGSANAKSCW